MRILLIYACYLEPWPHSLQSHLLNPTSHNGVLCKKYLPLSRNKNGHPAKRGIITHRGNVRDGRAQCSVTQSFISLTQSWSNTSSLTDNSPTNSCHPILINGTPSIKPLQHRVQKQPPCQYFWERRWCIFRDVIPVTIERIAVAILSKVTEMTFMFKKSCDASMSIIIHQYIDC